MNITCTEAELYNNRRALALLPTEAVEFTLLRVEPGLARVDERSCLGDGYFFAYNSDDSSPKATVPDFLRKFLTSGNFNSISNHRVYLTLDEANADLQNAIRLFFRTVKHESSSNS